MWGTSGEKGDFPPWRTPSVGGAEKDAFVRRIWHLECTKRYPKVLSVLVLRCSCKFSLSSYRCHCLAQATFPVRTARPFSLSLSFLKHSSESAPRPPFLCSWRKVQSPV